MRLGRFPFVVQKFLSSEDILSTAAEDGTRRVTFWSDRDTPESWRRTDKTDDLTTNYKADKQSLLVLTVVHLKNSEVSGSTISSLNTRRTVRCVSERTAQRLTCEHGRHSLVPRSRNTSGRLRHNLRHRHTSTEMTAADSSPEHEDMDNYLTSDKSPDHIIYLSITIRDQ